MEEGCGTLVAAMLACGRLLPGEGLTRDDLGTVA
jgi:hypothetical protein